VDLVRAGDGEDLEQTLFVRDQAGLPRPRGRRERPVPRRQVDRVVVLADL
jgi:hypothetical protein